MNILFAIALPQELQTVKKELKSLSYIGMKIDFLLTGVGCFNTIYSIKDYIDIKGKPDFIINIGVCGKIYDEVSDFFQVYRIKNLSNNKEALCPVYIHIHTLESVACSDRIITYKSDMGEEKFVDMESFGIDYIATKEKIPYIIIKKGFDVIGLESKHVNITDLEHHLQGYDYQSLINNIHHFLGNSKIDDTTEILQIKEKYRLTFSQTELCKKYINKKMAFGEKKESIIKYLLSREKKEILDLIKK